MNDSSQHLIYKKGVNLELDRELERYRKMRVFSGNAINEIFNDDEEFQTFGQLWQRERRGFPKLSVGDVSELLQFAKRITAYRAAAKRERIRKRSNRFRKKMRKAAKDEEPLAVRKLKRAKKSAKKRAAKSYERKRGKKLHR